MKRLQLVALAVALVMLSVPACTGFGFPRGSHSHSQAKPPSHAKPHGHGKLNDWIGRAFTAGGAATDPTTPAGLVDRFLVEAKLSPDNLPKQTDLDTPLPNRHMYTWYTRGGKRVTMIVDDAKRFDFDLTHPPPYETAGVNMVYYARRLDHKLLDDARLWIKEYGHESALKKLREVKGSRAKLHASSSTNHFAPVFDTKGNRKHRDWLPSSPQRAYLRIVFVSDNIVATHKQIAHALKGSVNIVVFQLHPTYLKQVWPVVTGRAPAVPLSSASASSASQSRSALSRSHSRLSSASSSSSQPSTAEKLAYLNKKWHSSWLAERGKKHSHKDSSHQSSNSTSSVSSSGSSSSASSSGSSLTKL